MYTNVLLNIYIYIYFANCVWHFHIHTRCVFLLENDVNFDRVLLCTCPGSFLVNMITCFILINCALVSKWNELMHALEGHRFAQKLPRFEPYKLHKWNFFLMPCPLGMFDNKYLLYSNVGQLSQTSLFHLKILSSFEKKLFSRLDSFFRFKFFS